MTGKIIGPAPGRPGEAPGRLSRDPLYAQAERVLENLLVRGRYRIGDRIPPEAELVRSLGVSRATIRAAVGVLVDRGLLVRRQGSGTFLTRLPEGGDRAYPVGIRLGSALAQLGRLETYTSMAQRLGLKIDSEQVCVEAAGASSDEAAALELARNDEVIRVSRVLFIDGEAAAWMIDVVRGDLLPARRIEERLSSRQMLLDVLLDEGVPIGFSEVEVGTAMLGAGEAAGSALELSEPTAALMLTETMYPGGTASADGRPVQWSRNYFLPGKLSLCLVREIHPDRDPAVVLSFLAST